MSEVDTILGSMEYQINNLMARSKKLYDFLDEFCGNGELLADILQDRVESDGILLDRLRENIMKLKPFAISAEADKKEEEKK